MQQQWSAEDIAVLAPLVVKERQNTGCLLFEAVDHAQRAALPQERWRTIASNNDVVRDKHLMGAIQVAEVRETPEVQVREGHLHVRWKAEHIEKLAPVVAKFLLQGYEMLDAVRLAQREVLPDALCRKLNSVSQIPKELIQSAETKAILAPAPGSVLDGIDQLPPSHEEVTLRSDAKLDELMARMTNIENLLTQLLNSREAPIPARAPVKPSIKILVVGGAQRPSHFDELRIRWAEVYDMTWMSVDSHHHVSHDRIKHSDYVIVLKRFVRTDAQRIIYSIKERERTFTIHGNLTEATRYLEEIKVKQSTH